VEVQDDLPVVNGDRARLVEVMQNLIDNAAKFSRDQPNPHVEVGMRKENDENVFFVKDNGIGIDPKFHQRIFDLFNKLDPLSDGTGVGLTLVKRIIEVHGGRIWVESDGKGSGSAFCFTLPTKEQNPI
jgi:signal transduction histidine kinase